MRRGKKIRARYGATAATRYGAEMTLPDWRERLICFKVRLRLAAGSAAPLGLVTGGSRDDKEAAMPRASWKGFLRLSLVSCPVYLSPASTRTKSIRLHQVWQPKGMRAAPVEEDEVEAPFDRQEAR